MFTFIGIMFVGVGLGYLLRNIQFLQKIHTSISWTILALLFFLGISVGHNESIVNNLQYLGLQALVLALLGTLGSVLAASLVYRLCFKEKEGK